MTSQDRKTALEHWLDAEIDRIWLLAERRLRRMQAAGAGFGPALGAIEGVLGVRRAGRGGGTTPDAEEVDRALAARGAQLIEERPRVPLGALAVRLELRPIELDVLISMIAPLIDPPLAELFQLVRGGTPRRGVDLALLGELFELDRAHRLELLQAIDADRPLVRWSLISIEGPRDGSLPIHRPLHIVPDVVATLCGGRQLPPGLVAHATVRRGRADLADLVVGAPLRATLEPLLAGLAAVPAPVLPWFVLWGPEGSGRRELATRLAAATGRSALLFDPSTCISDEIVPRLHIAQREALIRGAALVVGPLDADRPITEVVVRAVRRYPDLVLLSITSSQPPRLDTEHTLHEIGLAPLQPADAAILWTTALAAVPGGNALDLTKIVDGFRLTPGDILAATRTARTSATTQGRSVTVADVRRGVDLRLRAQLDGGVERIEATEGWDDVVLSDADRDRVREFIGRKRYASVVYDDWGLASRIRYGKGMIALFSGPPGTGKTMLAGVIARELDLELYRVDLSQVVSKWAGETEKQLARIFEIAERTQAVLLFDEADSLFGKRGETEGGRDRFANLTVNYLLQRLESYPGVAVLTTNKEASLDDALQRRLSLHLRLDFPEVDERTRLWRAFLPPQLPGAAGIDVGWLARRFELAGGSIKNAAVRAAFLAAGDGTPIDLPIVVAAVERELDDMGRVVWHLPDVRRESPPIDVTDVLLD